MSLGTNYFVEVISCNSCTKQFSRKFLRAMLMEPRRDIEIIMAHELTEKGWVWTPAREKTAAGWTCPACMAKKREAASC